MEDQLQKKYSYIEFVSSYGFKGVKRAILARIHVEKMLVCCLCGTWLWLNGWFLGHVVLEIVGKGLPRMVLLILG